MLILPEKYKQDVNMARHNEAKKNLVSQYNKTLEKILNENSHRTHPYWILGKTRFPEEFQGKVGRTFLEASTTKPPVIKNAFLYEVDNRTGTKTLLWVTHPDGSMRLPTLNKTVRISK